MSDPVQVPEGWRKVKLSEVTKVDPESLTQRTDPEYEFRYIDIASVSTGNIDIPTDRILFSESPSRARRVVRTNDVLMATVRPNLKAFAHYSGNGEDVVCSTGFAVIRSKEKSDSKFIFNTILSDEITRQIENLIVGSNYPAINSSDVKQLSFSIPPLPEQKKIASILTSVDDVIEKTEAQISKLQDLKKGMMTELLAKGIGHTEFKDSPVGRIPKSWDVKTVKEVVKSIKSGLSRRIVTQDIGLPMMISGNIQDNKLDTSELKYWYKDDPQGANTDNYLLQDGDILICFINSISQIGKCCIYQDIGRPAIYTTNMFRVQAKGGYSPDFLYQVFITKRFQDEIQLITKPAVNQASFTKADLEKIWIPVPPEEERNKIVSSVISIDDSLLVKQNKLSHTKSLKKALMNDLLTGKVRVSTTN